LDDISDLALFQAIVDAGGISAAALALQSSPPAVSRRLSALEARLGVRLAERSSRRFRLTNEGLVLSERSRAILAQVRDMEAEVASRGGVARGRLRVGAPTDLGHRHIAPRLAAFAARHPGLEGHLILSDAGLEVEADGCDLVLRFGLPNDDWVIARKVATTRRVLCAAPSYIAKRGRPETPEQLVNHSCLRFTRRNQMFDRWSFSRGEGELCEVKVGGALSSGDGEVLRAWALSGEGISLEAFWDVEADLAAGRLVEILPDYQSQALELYAVFAAVKPTPPRIGLFIELLIEAFREGKQEAAF
jgi:LysR family transcriptional regulator, transcriptional activator for dmlA